MTPTEIQNELDELETRLERLRIKYEQYFAGVEKMLPFVQRKDVDRRFQTLHHEQIRNTGMRFRFQTMAQRFTSLQTHWGRIIRQIEEGTFKRDVNKARRLVAAQSAPRDDEPQEISSDMLEEVEDESVSHARSTTTSLRPTGDLAREELPMFPTDDDNDAAGPPPSLRAPAMSRLTPSMPPSQDAPASPQNRASSGGFFGAGRPAPGGFTVPPPKAAPTPAAPVPRPAAPAPAPTPAAAPVDPRMKQLYDRYIEARRQTGENTNVQFESVARQVRESLPRLAEKYKGADVSLDVTIKDGKAVLRPVVTTRKP